ncbi:kinase-like domain-containing protein, partial [Globomyces pollinis-pini]
MIDDYEIIQEIGRGSFATVFKGKLGNGQIVAIKSVQKAKLNRKLNENLETEIAILNKSRHRNVVSLFTVTKSEKEIHLVMEFCALGDLSIFIKKRGGLDEFVVRHLLGQLASAIEFLRFHQIIHRDLKPQNILLAAPPNAGSINTSHMTITDQKACYLPILKLGDFGFARSLEFQDMASTLCGSPLYMAPEILRGEKYDAKSDLWSLGAIAYEMITGKTPFRAQNHIELIRKIERGDGWIRFPDE